MSYNGTINCMNSSGNNKLAFLMFSSAVLTVIIIFIIYLSSLVIINDTSEHPLTIKDNDIFLENYILNWVIPSVLFGLLMLVYFIFIYLKYMKFVKSERFRFLLSKYLYVPIFLASSSFLIWFGSDFFKMAVLPDIINPHNIEVTSEWWFNTAVSSISLGSIFILIFTMDFVFC